MVINNDVVDVTSSGVTESTKARIVVNTHMIKLLSSGLYQDKIMAVLRELSANAVDSMKEAGTLDTHKFEVHLPTILEPYFKIRDYGTGLSPEGIKRVYINYGASTKTGTNDQIGGFGVGAKAPFSYTHSYIIVSYYNGTKTLYSYGISADGIPELSKISSETTDEHNGLEIQLPVANQDINTFTAKAATLYVWFDYKPEVNVDLSYPREIASIDTDNFTLYNSASKGLFVKMGGIVYKFDAYAAGYKYGHSIYNLHYNCKLLIKANIGDLDVTASRESIEITDKTKSYIEKAVVDFSDTIVDNVYKSVEAATTLWNKCAIINSMIHVGGFDIKSYMIKYPSDTVINHPDGVSIRTFSLRRCYSGGLQAGSLHNYTGTIQPRINTVVIVCDVPYNSNYRTVIADHLNSDTRHDEYEVLLVSRPTSVKIKDWGVKIISIIENLGNPDYMLLSTLSPKFPEKLRILPTNADLDFALYGYVPMCTSYPYLRMVQHGYTALGIMSYKKLAPDKVYYYLVANSVCTLDVHIDTTISKMLGNPDTIFIVAKSNTRLVKKAPNMVEIVEYLNSLPTMTVLDITELKDSIKGTAFDMTYISKIIDANTKYKFPIITTMKEELDDLKYKIIADESTIKQLRALGINFNVQTYKLPEILKNFGSRFHALVGDKDRLYHMISGESMSTQTVKLLKEVCR